MAPQLFSQMFANMHVVPDDGGNDDAAEPANIMIMFLERMVESAAILNTSMTTK